MTKLLITIHGRDDLTTDFDDTEVMAVDLDAYPHRFYPRRELVHLPLVRHEALAIDPWVEDGSLEDWKYLRLRVIELDEEAPYGS